MPKRIHLLIIIALLTLTLAGYGQTTVKIAILHTNDHHGRLEAFDIVGQKNVGGMAARLTLVNTIRRQLPARNSGMLLLDCGDINTGEPVSDILLAEPDVKLMNLIGYDAMAVGNHEFDLPLPKLLEQSRIANFPYLGANVFYRDSGKRVFSAWKLFTIHGVRIAVIGAVTAKVPDISTCGNDPRLEFRDPEQVLPEILRKLRPRADFIVVLIHLEHPEVLQLAAKFPQVDIFIGGHTHLPISRPVKVGTKTLVTEAGAYGLMVGRFDLTFIDRQLHHWDYQLIGVNLSQPIRDEDGNILCRPYPKKFAAAPQVKRFLAPYLARTEKLLGQEIGSATADIPKAMRSLRPHSSPLGNLIADAIREFSKSDIALQNTGGVRADLLKGPITHRTIRQILPFANSVIIYRLTGKQVMDIFRTMIANGPGQGGVLEVSGITLRIENQRIFEVKVGSKPIVADAIYKVAVNSFLASGGDGYQLFKKFSDKLDSGFYLAPILTNYIKKHTPISPCTEFRMRWNN